MNRIRAFLITGAVIAVDRVFKAWITSWLPLATPRPLIGNTLRLTRVHNVGGAFGVFPGSGILFIVVSSLAVCVLTFLLIARRGTGTLSTLGMSMVLGGAAGNLIDRLAFGYVIDFFELRGFPVINVADASISIGAALIVLAMLLQGRGRHTAGGGGPVHDGEVREEP